jgi:hypothetical protein
MRRESRWIGDHVPSTSAIVHGTQVWETFAAHLFRGAGLPTIRNPRENKVLQGYVRYEGRNAATSEEAQKAIAIGRRPPKARSAAWSGLNLQRNEDGGLEIHIHVTRNRARHLTIPVATEGDAQARCPGILNRGKPASPIHVEPRAGRDPRLRIGLVEQSPVTSTPTVSDAEDSPLSDVGVGKAHAERLRDEASTTESDRPRGRQLRLDG